MTTTFHYEEAAVLEFKTYKGTLAFWAIWSFIKCIGTASIKFKNDCPSCIVQQIRETLDSKGIKTTVEWPFLNLENGLINSKESPGGFNWRYFDIIHVERKSLPERCFVIETEK